MIRIFLILAGFGVFWMQSVTAAEPWVLIDSQNRSLQVFKDGRMLAEFGNISFGRNGVSDFRTEGDGSTPTGTFHVSWINRQSGYLLFFGLNYPNKQHAEIALRKHIIDVDTYFDIVKAEYRHQRPPQNTVLGGQIGIHGLGHDADRKVHHYFNWTKGCVALTDRQITDLDTHIKIGTKVVIR